jgi:16S rRNA G966 N2-methylase RsmD
MTCKESMRGGMGLSGNLFGPEPQKGPVECLGMTFPDDAARRAHFLKRLRSALEELHSVLGVPFSGVEDAVARLKSLQNWPLPEDDRLHALAERMRRGDPGKSLLERWKDEVGFPRGDIEDILRLSDPPYYTACPNPFLAEFVRHYGKPYNPEELYHREPFAVDVSEGKTDPIYTAHSYHTKVPPRAIVRALLHYTEPGDLVLDGFAGSGMTGVAAQMCGHPDPQFKATVEAEWKAAGRGAPRWGARRAILNDLSPLATFLAAGYNLPFDVQEFEREARRLLKEVEDELGWMYETRHTDGKRTGRINYTVWSEVFGCRECGNEVTFLEQALDPGSKRVQKTFNCPHCNAELTKSKVDRLYETYLDSALQQPVKRLKRRPVRINYQLGNYRFEKDPDEEDLARIAKIEAMASSPVVPTDEIPYMHMTHERARMSAFGITHVHHFFLPRSAQALGALWAKAAAVEDVRLRHMLLFFVEQAVWGMSLLNRYQPIQQGRPGGSQVNRQLTGVYYIASQHSEVSPWYNLTLKLKRLLKAFSNHSTSSFPITTGTAHHMLLPSNSVDYIFTDPPFGENIYYADLNFLLESWHGVFTNAAPEAIIDQAKKKELRDYQRLMQRCFEEYYRVLKPGRWMTVVFHNSWNAVWNAIQEAMMAAGFVVADVRTMDKKQGSYRQVTSSAV